MTQQPTLRIGTRGSPLALAQAREVKTRLIQAHRDLNDDAIRIDVIRTSGDRIRDKPLREFGGKGLFTKEIEDALLNGDIDLAVHSMKDVPTELPGGLGIVAILEREDPRDAFISPVAGGIEELPAGALVGSSSLRRVAQLRHLRPDIEVVDFRGNVETRLAKLAAGDVAATFLACAGLNRLGLSGRITAAIPARTMLPAVAQGAIGIECRLDDATTKARLAPLDHRDTAIRVSAERSLLAALDGSCRTPIAALAEIQDNGDLRLRGEVLRPDGSERLSVERLGNGADAAEIGLDAGGELRRRAGPDFFAGL
jgi:hydroxymethylbilane synthase